MGSRITLASKMKLFLIAFFFVTLVRKSSILDVAGVIDPTLIFVSN